MVRHPFGSIKRQVAANRPRDLVYRNRRERIIVSLYARGANFVIRRRARRIFSRSREERLLVQHVSSANQ